MCIQTYSRLHEQLRPPLLSASPCLAVIVSSVTGAQTLVEASEQVYKDDLLLWLIITVSAGLIFGCSQQFSVALWVIARFSINRVDECS